MHGAERQSEASNVLPEDEALARCLEALEPMAGPNETGGMIERREIAGDHDIEGVTRLPGADDIDDDLVPHRDRAVEQRQRDPLLFARLTQA